ncbi:MAG: histidine phosphatase family protein [Rhodocyclaceae bacterium]|nr:histidine phosphatase family protein [Rhodocyclaceae bacterium]
MSLISLRRQLFLLLAWFVQLAWAVTDPPPLDAKILAQLRMGGYTLYVRHGATDLSRPDRAPKVDLADCSTQRPLSDLGREQARRLQAALRRLRIPIGEVLASPFCRTREFAELAFGSYRIEPRLMATSNLTDEEIAPHIERFKALLAERIPKGANRALAGHSTVMMDALGYLPKPEGVTLIIEGDGQGFRFLARMTLEDWERLAAEGR